MPPKTSAILSAVSLITLVPLVMARLRNILKSTQAQLAQVLPNPICQNDVIGVLGLIFRGVFRRSPFIEFMGKGMTVRAEVYKIVFVVTSTFTPGPNMVLMQDGREVKPANVAYLRAWLRPAIQPDFCDFNIHCVSIKNKTASKISFSEFAVIFSRGLVVRPRSILFAVEPA